LALGIGVCIGICGSLASTPARAGNDQREAKGRSLFATGEYQAALDIFVALFGEKGDPVFLRNIGRCYQKLRQPAKAIDAYQEYLRRYQRLKPAERREVEGFIEDMNKLKAEQEAEASAEAASAARSEPPRAVPPPRPSPALAPPAELPSAPPDSGAKPGQASLVIAQSQGGQAEPGASESKPLTSRWWFWAGAGGVVVLGAVVTALVVTSGGGATGPPCQPPYVCPR
jgi:tetratricopeptide (TPR) repeat protein